MPSKWTDLRSDFSMRAAVFWLGGPGWDRAPRGLIGPGFGLPWPAGGQVGWPSRWDHFSGPGGRTAGRFPFPRVRFQRWPCWGPKSSRSVPRTVLVPLCGARLAPPSGRKNGEATDLEGYHLEIPQSSSARSKWAISWSVAASPPAVATSHGTRALRHFMDALLSKKATR